MTHTSLAPHAQNRWFRAIWRPVVTAVAVASLVVIPAVGAHAIDDTSTDETAIDQPSVDGPGPDLATTAVAGALNTGIPAWVVPTKFYGDITVTKDGTVLNGLEIYGLVTVEAKNVVIKNSIIKGRTVTTNKALITARSAKATNLQIQDVTLAPTKASPYINGIYGGNFTMRRVDIYNVIDSVHVFGDKVRVFNSWLHDNLHYVNDPTWNGKPSHDDNIQVQRGTDLWFAGNTISGARNAVLMVTQGMGTTSRLLFESNRISGGSCSVNITNAGRSTVLKRINLRHNAFGASNSGCNVIIDKSARKNTVIKDNWRTDGRTFRINLR